MTKIRHSDFRNSANDIINVEFNGKNSQTAS